MNINLLLPALLLLAVWRAWRGYKNGFAEEIYRLISLVAALFVLALLAHGRQQLSGRRYEKRYHFGHSSDYYGNRSAPVRNHHEIPESDCEASDHQLSEQPARSRRQESQR